MAKGSRTICGENSTFVYFNLDPLRPELGSAACGRISLPNGETAIFDISSLSRFLKAVADEDLVWNNWSVEDTIPSVFSAVGKPGPQNGLYAGAFASAEGNVYAECLFIDPSGAVSPPAGGKAIKDTEGKVWLMGQKQVANRYDGVWKEVGGCSAEGEEITLGPQVENDRGLQFYNLDMQVFARYVGRYRFGKVTLSNGFFATFDLENLASP